ncbi:hypothetical protein JB92DRAFT_3081660 [Gautieria morchelliformis]|nr:hypothetical protein JB92DRAFT_3081660 [Gautieria morchelliformis]
MPAIPVAVKHAGKTHQLQLDTDAPATAFKNEVYQVTGVPPDRMKVMIKGGVLKDDTDWRKVAPKPNQTFMVVGAAGELPKPPPKPVVFLEDMDDTELAEALNMPVGLKNLGNTCYMNATVQAMRAIPELQTSLREHSSLTSAMRDLYNAMGKTTEGFPPYMFLQILRQVVPQFNEQSRAGAGPAQQDAEECWTQVVNSLSVLPGVVVPGATSQKKFVEQFMMGEMTTEYVVFLHMFVYCSSLERLRCNEAPEEEPTTLKEKITKVSCNISKETNYMHSGLMGSLDQTIEKHSATLGREAQYTQHSRISRLPSNLMVHMVRFHWRRDINKKAKIMRKVKFPFELDAMEMVTDELKRKLADANGKVKQVEGERAERRKVRRKTKRSGVGICERGGGAGAEDVPMADAREEGKGKGKAEEPAAGELEDEAVLRERESKEFEALIDPELKADIGASVTGLFELCAIVTHKGASADSGHYIGFVKKDAFHPTKSYLEEDNEDCESAPHTVHTMMLRGMIHVAGYQFDDDKVSVVTREKIAALDGGGEAASAYMLLYRQKRL